MPSRLPNAPLTEVVFEMRWGVAQPSDIPPPLSPDPGYPSIVDTFTSFARKSGFKRHVNIQELVYGGLAHGISRRFYRGEENFPLLQIGPGIFAANDSSQYEWKSFRALAEKGATDIIKNYPKFKEFALEITQLELRYIDAFEEDLIGSSNFLEFIGKATTTKIELSPFLENRSIFSHEKRMRVQFNTDVKGMANTVFAVDIGTGKKGDIPVIRLESKVITQAGRVIPVGQSAIFSTKLRTWLEKAHGITSPFFKDFVKQDVFEKFK